MQGPAGCHLVALRRGQTDLMEARNGNGNWIKLAEDMFKKVNIALETFHSQALLSYFAQLHKKICDFA
jgi:hypothetical protein